jgi:hypothetical protein
MRTCLADLAMKDRKVYPFVGAFCSRFDGFFSGFFTMSQQRAFSCFCLPPWMAFVQQRQHSKVVADWATPYQHSAGWRKNGYAVVLFPI